MYNKSGVTVERKQKMKFTNEECVKLNKAKILEEVKKNYSRGESMSPSKFLKNTLMDLVEANERIEEESK